MTKYIFFTFYVTMVTLFFNPVTADESDFVVLNYEILSEGKDVGDMTLKLFQQKSGHVIVSHTHIKASGWWWSINITTILSEQFQHKAGLIKADGKTLDENTAYWTKINAYDDEYRADFMEINKTTTQENEQFSGLSFAVAGRVSSNTEEILSLSEALFTDRKGQIHGVTFPKNSFDTTFNDLAFFIQKNAGKPLPKKLNILDTENLEIIQMSISDLGLETMLIGVEKIQVRHLTLSDEKFPSSHIWIKEDLSSLPYFVRHTGEDEDGKFEIILKPN